MVQIRSDVYRPPQGPTPPTRLAGHSTPAPRPPRPSPAPLKKEVPSPATTGQALPLGPRRSGVSITPFHFLPCVPFGLVINSLFRTQPVYMDVNGPEVCNGAYRA